MTEQEKAHFDYESFRMYHQLQYDRIDKHESKRETFSNIVLTLSAGLYLLGLGDLEKLNTLNCIFVSLIVILVNVAAIIFASKSRYWIKLHQERAAVAIEEYAPELKRLDVKAFEKYTKKIDEGRNNHWWVKLFKSEASEKNLEPNVKSKSESEDKSVPETDKEERVIQSAANDDEKPTKRDSDKDWLRREKIYQYLHFSVIAISIFSIFSFIGLKKTSTQKDPIQVEIINQAKISVDLIDTLKTKSFPMVRDSN